MAMAFAAFRAVEKRFGAAANAATRRFLSSKSVTTLCHF
jgi:hypothetical protein